MPMPDWGGAWADGASAGCWSDSPASIFVVTSVVAFSRDPAWVPTKASTFSDISFLAFTKGDLTASPRLMGFSIKSTTRASHSLPSRS